MDVDAITNHEEYLNLYNQIANLPKFNETDQNFYARVKFSRNTYYRNQVNNLFCNDKSSFHFEKIRSRTNQPFRVYCTDGLKNHYVQSWYFAGWSDMYEGLCGHLSIVVKKYNVDNLNGDES